MEDITRLIDLFTSTAATTRQQKYAKYKWSKRTDDIMKFPIHFYPLCRAIGVTEEQYKSILPTIIGIDKTTTGDNDNNVHPRMFATFNIIRFKVDDDADEYYLKHYSETYPDFPGVILSGSKRTRHENYLTYASHVKNFAVYFQHKFKLQNNEGFKLLVPPNLITEYSEMDQAQEQAQTQAQTQERQIYEEEDDDNERDAIVANIQKKIKEFHDKDWVFRIGDTFSLPRFMEILGRTNWNTIFNPTYKTASNDLLQYTTLPESEALVKIVDYMKQKQDKMPMCLIKMPSKQEFLKWNKVRNQRVNTYPELRKILLFYPDSEFNVRNKRGRETDVTTLENMVVCCYRASSSMAKWILKKSARNTSMEELRQVFSVYGLERSEASEENVVGAASEENEVSEANVVNQVTEASESNDAPTEVIPRAVTEAEAEAESEAEAIVPEPQIQVPTQPPATGRTRLKSTMTTVETTTTLTQTRIHTFFSVEEPQEAPEAPQKAPHNVEQAQELVETREVSEVLETEPEVQTTGTSSSNVINSNDNTDEDEVPVVLRDKGKQREVVVVDCLESIEKFISTVPRFRIGDFYSLPAFCMLLRGATVDRATGELTDVIDQNGNVASKWIEIKRQTQIFQVENCKAQYGVHTYCESKNYEMGVMDTPTKKNEAPTESQIFYNQMVAIRNQINSDKTKKSLYTLKLASKEEVKIWDALQEKYPNEYPQKLLVYTTDASFNTKGGSPTSVTTFRNMLRVCYYSRNSPVSLWINDQSRDFVARIFQGEGRAISSVINHYERIGESSQTAILRSQLRTELREIRSGQVIGPEYVYKVNAFFKDLMEKYATLYFAKYTWHPIMVKVGKSKNVFNRFDAKYRDDFFPVLYAVFYKDKAIVDEAEKSFHDFIKIRKWKYEDPAIRYTEIVDITKIAQDTGIEDYDRIHRLMLSVVFKRFRPIGVAKYPLSSVASMMLESEIEDIINEFPNYSIPQQILPPPPQAQPKRGLITDEDIEEMVEFKKFKLEIETNFKLEEKKLELAAAAEEKKLELLTKEKKLELLLEAKIKLGDKFDVKDIIELMK